MAAATLATLASVFAAKKAYEIPGQISDAKKAAEDQAKTAQETLDLQKAEVKKQEDAFAQEKLNTEAAATRDAARRRQKQKMSGGISSTILTSPLGLNGTPGVSGKTLLGE